MSDRSRSAGTTTACVASSPTVTIVTQCIARGVDPANVSAGELTDGMPVTIESQADVTEVLRAMEQHKIHRLPVIENQQPVGMISQADLARHLPENLVGEFIEAVCAS
jgi:CBS domain-containing protein